MRRRGRSYGTIARRAAALAGAGYGIASRTRQLFGAKRVEAPAVTNQYDVKTTYRKKRMPRRKKRGWLKFKRRVMYASNSSGAKQVLLFRGVNSYTCAAGSQKAVSAFLYGDSTAAGTVDDFGAKDMQDVWDSWRNTAAVGDNQNTGKINFTSGVLDIEMSNIGGEGYVNSLTIDVYHVRCKKTPRSYTEGFAYLFNDSLTANSLPNMSANNTVQLDDAQSGVTPFHAPVFSKSVEILNVKKVLLSVGQSTHFQLRLSKDKIYTHQVQSNDSALKAGWTEGYLFIVQGVAGPSDFSLPVKFVINANRTYHFRVDAAYENYGGLI